MGAWNGREVYFHEDGTWKVSGRHDAKSRSLETRVNDNGRELGSDYSEDDQNGLLELLRGYAAI